MSAQITDATIADNVRGAAAAAEMDLVDLGAQSGIADRTWWRRLTGRSPWQVSEIVSVADTLGIDAASLLNAQEAHSHAA